MYSNMSNRTAYAAVAIVIFSYYGYALCKHVYACVDVCVCMCVCVCLCVV